jgi:hypothetical protein
MCESPTRWITILTRSVLSVVSDHRPLCNTIGTMERKCEISRSALIHQVAFVVIQAKYIAKNLHVYIKDMCIILHRPWLKIRYDLSNRYHAHGFRPLASGVFSAFESLSLLPTHAFRFSVAS